MAILSTKVEFTSIKKVATLDGDLDGEFVKEQFQIVYPYLANCSFTESIEGDTRVIRFSEKMGTKG